MRTRIAFNVSSVEFYDTGHEVEDVSVLNGCTIVAVDDLGADQIILTVEDSRPQNNKVADKPAPNKRIKQGLKPHAKRTS